MFSASSSAFSPYLFGMDLCLILDNGMWVEIMYANFWVQKYLILFPHLLAHAKIFKDLEDEEKKKEPGSLNYCLCSLHSIDPC